MTRISSAVVVNLFVVILLTEISQVSAEIDQQSNAYSLKYLQYNAKEWKPVATNNINYGTTTYVIIHGAFTSVKKCNYVTSVAKALRAKDPFANIIAIDWEKIAHIKTDVKMISDLSSYLPEKLKNNLKNCFQSEQEQIKYQNDLVNGVSGLMIQYLPIEQANYIPEISKEACVKLFGKNITAGQLAIPPEKTQIIGHSHGAHIAGLICSFSVMAGFGKVHQLTALEPSPEELHHNPANWFGTGWDANSATEVVVIKTSRYFSNNFNYKSVTNNYAPPAKPVTLKTLANVLYSDYQRHQLAWNVYISPSKYSN